MQFALEWMRELQRRLDPHRLMFVDEIWIKDQHDIVAGLGVVRV